MVHSLCKHPILMDPFHVVIIYAYTFFYLGSQRGEPRNARNAPPKILPIETPALSLDELNRMTGNFGQKALIGEGSYGRVFYAKLSNGDPAAVKKLDTSSSAEPDNDFAAQVYVLGNFFLLNEMDCYWT